MNMQHANEIRELTAEDMEGVTGGLTPAFLFPAINSIYWGIASVVGCVQDETGHGTTVGNCDTF